MSRSHAQSRKPLVHASSEEAKSDTAGPAHPMPLPVMRGESEGGESEGSESEGEEHKDGGGSGGSGSAGHEYESEGGESEGEEHKDGGSHRRRH
jgi:hypothetical protein